MKCYIVKDLLPGYIDGLTCEEANAEIQEHLKDCRDCRRVYEQMSASMSQDIVLPENKALDQNIDFLKKLKRKIRHRYAAVAAATCLTLWALAVFAGKYQIAVPYDPEHMTTETYQAVPVVNEFGITQWTDVDALNFEETEAVIREGQDPIDLVRFVVRESEPYDDFRSYGRTILRDGQEVRVVYYCYTKSLRSCLALEEKACTFQMKSTGDIYGLRLHRADYTPVMTELYYLPMDGLFPHYRFARLSDREFDGQRDEAELVWSGMN